MKKGFDSEIFDSQAVFRSLLDATAFPGTIRKTPVSPEIPDGLHPATGAVLLTLMDFETPFWSDAACPEESVEWLCFHTGAPFTSERSEAAFALCTDCRTLPEPGEFMQGTPIAPHLSTTMIIQISDLGTDGRLRLSGPGIIRSKKIGLTGIENEFIRKRNQLNAAYPLGLDMIFVADDRFISLPRTSKLEAE